MLETAKVLASLNQRPWVQLIKNDRQKHCVSFIVDSLPLTAVNLSGTIDDKARVANADALP